MTEETAAEVVLPETLDLLLRGNLNRKTLRAAIAAELEKRGPPLNVCQGCRYFDFRRAEDRCELHGRLTSPKNYCSWWEAL